jgi:1-pyrroline-5-carboxylate dehydrogenase
MMAQKLKVTYATMSADNEDMQAAFDVAIDKVRDKWLGAEAPMFINGEWVYAEDKFSSYSPINTEWHICTAQSGTIDHAAAAIAAAKAARQTWAATPWQERVRIIREIAEQISENSFDLSALMIFEVGKNRLEALGEVEETADLLRWYADSMEKNHGFINEMGKLNPDDPTENNFSVLRPHGVWVVISPFNFPMALSAAPIAAALVTGNTVVFKGALDTPYCNYKITELFANAGLPAGVFNSILGPDKTVGQSLVDSLEVNGYTFTGSHEVGMMVLRKAANGPYPRPAIVEMGGKNPTIISKTADLTKAATGVMRAAFGMDGQKCSACSRVYIQEEVYDAFKAKLIDVTNAIKVGDPTERTTFMGTVGRKEGYDNYKKYIGMAQADGTILAGGKLLTEGEMSKGYFVAPTIIEGLPEDHPLVKNELFLPIVYIAKVSSLDEAMEKANDTVLGLTAGFFGEDEQEVEWFLNNIQAGTIYANRAAGATTGAWPGVQSFGGWKGSGSTGKAIGALYTLPLYMREQSHTIIG